MKTHHTTFKIILVSLVLLSGFQMNAQEKRLNELSAEELSEKQTTFFSEKLSLNEKESQQLQDINLKYAKEVKQLQAEGRSKATREKLEKLNHDHNAEVKTLLSEEDFGEFLVLKKQMEQHRQMKMKERRIEAQYNANQEKRERRQERKAFMEKMNLNEDQKQEMKAIKESYGEKFEKIRAEGRSPETRKKLEALREAQNKEVKSVLNEEQYELYMEMQEKRRQNMKKNRGQQRG
jgi:hypothetical protein